MGRAGIRARRCRCHMRMSPEQIEDNCGHRCRETATDRSRYCKPYPMHSRRRRPARTNDSLEKVEHRRLESIGCFQMRHMADAVQLNQLCTGDGFCRLLPQGGKVAHRFDSFRWCKAAPKDRAVKLADEEQS